MNNKQQPIIEAIPAFDDNYIWAITQVNSPYLVLVDPGDASVCIKYIEKKHKILCDILITHKHYDHVDGIEELLTYSKEKQWSVNVHGPKNEQIPHCTNSLSSENKITLSPLGITFNIIDLPGHTLGHIAYFADNEHPILFCGDTLFSGGCGRIFEGSPTQMLSSLKKLAALPNNTQVYCTHEYTLANLNFAKQVEPDNQTLADYLDNVKAKRNNDQPSLPTTIQLEKAINPFFRCNETTIKTTAETYSSSTLPTEIAVFTAIRQWKNNV